MKSLFLQKHSVWQHFCIYLPRFSSFFFFSFYEHRGISLILQELVIKFILHILRTLAFKRKLMYLSDNVALKISSVHYIFLWGLVFTVKKALAHEEKLSEQSSFGSDRLTVKFSTVKTVDFQSQQAFAIHYEVYYDIFYALWIYSWNPDSLFPLLLPVVKC